MTDDIMTRVWDAYWSDEDAKRGTQAALERVVCIVREEYSARIAPLEAENADLKERLFRFGEENERMSSALASFERDNADLRCGEYLVRVIEERERLRKALAKMVEWYGARWVGDKLLPKHLQNAEVTEAMELLEALP